MMYEVISYIMKTRQRQQESTRAAILAALGEIILESGMGFSIQSVADRAGVTARTIYNHFPTREALNDAFAVYVEEVIGKQQGEPPPDADQSLDAFCTGNIFRFFTGQDAYIRAYVMLMIASRSSAKVASDRTAKLATRLKREAEMSDAEARCAAVALRMFVSSTGYHLLTEQHGLTLEQASAVTNWVSKTLLAAIRAGDLPELESNHA